MRQYLRKCILTLSGGSSTLTVSDLKIAFDIDKDADKNANSSTIAVYNLNKENRGKIKKEFDHVRLEAGYQGTLGARGNVGVIFDGQISDFQHVRSETDIISMLECGDGDEGLRQGVVAKSYPKDTAIKTIITDLQKLMPGVALGELKGIDKLQAFTRPLVLCGPCFRELDKLGRTFKFFWSIQDGALEIVPEGEAFDHVIKISPHTGMVGVPTITDTGVKVQTLLNPDLRIGHQIEVESETLEMSGKQSRYRISGLVFQGDNMDGEFLADIEGESMDQLGEQEGATASAEAS